MKYCLLFLLVFLACTDYVAEIDDQIDEVRESKAMLGQDSLSSSENYGSSGLSSSFTVPVLSSSSEEQPSSSSEVQYSSSTFVCQFGNTLVDYRDGQTYETAIIGSQTWMAKNLNYAVDGSYCYDNNFETCTYFGRLYTWNAAKYACPEGWRLPTKDEFAALVDALGGIAAAGEMLKPQSLRDDETYSANPCSFLALPGGVRNTDGAYEQGGRNTYFWSSSMVNRGYAYLLYLYFDIDFAGLGYQVIDNGASVRCIQN